MEILILGAGQVGATLAENLAREDNDITVVDCNVERLQELQTRLDIRTLEGFASHPGVLQKAGCAEADLLIAVTNNDETNMIACRIAATLFNTPTKIARIRSPQYLTCPELFGPDALPVDVHIAPEQIVTNSIQRLIEYPDALQVLDFAKGRVQLVAVKSFYGGILIGRSLKSLREYVPEAEIRVAAIFRNKKSIPISGDTVIEVDDEIFFYAAHHHLRHVLSAFRRLHRPSKNVMIAGGGNIGLCLASTLEDRYNTKLIEMDPVRAEQLAAQLDECTVLLSDAANKELLLSEEIEQTDVFCAVTNDDEANIMSAMLAKQLGARKVIALVTKSAYVDLIEGSDIDIAISPQQITIGEILKHIRRADIVKVHSLRRGAAEAIEAIAHGDIKTSNVVGRSIEMLELPKGARVGAIVRGKKVLMPHHDIVIEENDHVIIFLEDKSRVRAVEKLFQVGLTFF